MSRRDKERGGPVAGTKNRSNNLAAIGQRRSISFVYTRFCIGPDESRLRTAYGRDVQKHADVRSDADSLRMSYPLTVHEDQIRHLPQAGQRPNYRRTFAEGKVTGNIGKSDWQTCVPVLDREEIREGEERCNSDDEAAGKCCVDPGDDGRLFSVRLNPDVTGELFLDDTR